MGRQRFAPPDVSRLRLSDGDYIDVKRRLSHGEREEMFARMAPRPAPEGGFELSRREVRTARVLASLVGWSFTDAAGAPAAFSPRQPEAERLSAILALDPDTFDEVLAALDAHEAAQEAAREALKKTPGGAPADAPTSPSPSVLAGATSGSGG